MYSKASFERVITLLRFPMMAGIVVIHCNITTSVISGESNSILIQPSFDIITFFSEILCRIFVPMFFLISGYLFFYKKDGSQFGFYTTQWGKRVKTLLIPYLLWNLFALLLTLFKCYGPLQDLFPRLAADPITFKECFEAFWALRPADALDGVATSIYEPSSTPVNTPLWFVRDLLVMMLISPLLYRILRIKVIGGITVLALLVMFLSGIWLPYSTGGSLTTVTFFTMGSWLSIQKIDPTDYIERYFSIKKVFYIFLILFGISAGFELNGLDTVVGMHLHAISIVLGIVMIATLSALFTKNKVIALPSILVASSFFIYGFHSMFLSILKPAIRRYLILDTNFEWLGCYFGLIIFTLIVSVLAFYISHKSFPKFTRLLTGSR